MKTLILIISLVLLMLVPVRAEESVYFEMYKSEVLPGVSMIHVSFEEKPFLTFYSTGLLVLDKMDDETRIKAFKILEKMFVWQDKE